MTPRLPAAAMETVRSGLRIVGSVAAHAAVGVGAGSVAAVSTVLPSTGGAIDLIAVRQPDGSLRCSPFYVRFGKYQGLIRGPEKVVTVTVNGVLTDFTMRLGRNGEAFFVETTETAELVDVARLAASLEDGGAQSADVSILEEGATDDELSEDDMSNLEGEIARLRRGVASTSRGSSGVNSDDGLDAGPHPFLRTISSISRAERDLLARADSLDPEDIASEVEKLALETASARANRGDGEETAGGDEKTLEGLREVAAKLDLDASTTDADADADAHGGGGSSGDDTAKEVSKEGSPDAAKREATAAAATAATREAAATAAREQLAAADPAPGGWGWLHGWRGEKTPTAASAASAEVSARSSPAKPPADVVDVGSIERGYLSEVDAGAGAGKDVEGRGAKKASGSAATGGSLLRARRNTTNSSTETVPLFVSVPSVPMGAARVDRTDSLRSSGEVDAMDDATTSMAAATLSLLGGGANGGAVIPHLELSLCGGDLGAFDEHRVELHAFVADPSAFATHPALLVRPARPRGAPPAPPLPWAAAAPHLLGHLAFGTPLPGSWLNTPGGAMKYASVPGSPIAARRSFSAGGSPLRAPSSAAAADVTRAARGKTLKRPKRKLRKSITLNSDQVSALGLRPGKNVIAFSFQSRVWGRQEVQAHAYLWDWNAKVVVSDVDGTITKSDVLGHLAPMVGKDWNHAGVATLYNNIKDNGYQLMFLSSRAISQSKNTRQYLEKLTQDGETLTQGPVMLAPDPLSTALYREVVVRRPQEFKMRCLRTIRDLFPPEWNPFYAGFGNRETDTVSYASVGVPPGRNFTINPKSEVVAEVTKMTKRYTLAGINELVDEMFPAVEESVDINVPAECDQFGDCQFWKKDIPEIDLDDLP